MIYRALACVALAISLAGCASRGDDYVVSIAGQWAFQPGDNPAWAAPGFDDSSWPRLTVPKSWGRQGFDHVKEFAWYRYRVAGPWPQDAVVGLILGKVESAYELYIGGRLVGGVGKLPPDPRPDYDQHSAYTVAPDMKEPDGSFVIALRVWRAPPGSPGSAGPVEGPYTAGPLQTIVMREMRNEALQLALVFMFLVAAVYHLVLRVMRSNTAEYGWFGLVAIEAALYCFFRTQWKYQLFDRFVGMKKFEHVLLYVTLATFLQFIWVFFREPISRPLRVAQMSLLAAAAFVVVSPGLDAARQMLLFLYLMLGVLIVALLWLIATKIRAGERDARIIGLGALVVAAAFVNDAMVERNLYVGPRFGVYGFGVLVVGMSMTLAYRFQRALGEVEALTHDLESRVETRTMELSKAYKQMEDLALRDGLTGLLNRRSLQERAMAGLSSSNRKKQKFALAMVDIDHFKRVNDTLGHAAGDQVLAEVARRLTAVVRASDDVGRWGGEEFLVLFPELDREGARQAAERLRSRIETEPVVVEGGEELKITVSVGVAVIDEPAPSTIVLEALTRMADDALYSAKDGGRNQVIVAA